jgi:DNA polymerase IV (DinB-like DNA polymerase)
MFIHIDMDYFFAQAEELRHPEYKGKIVVVCVYSGRTEDSGVVSTVNYEGRKYGIHSGQPIYQAKQRAPPADSVFIPVDHEYYLATSDKIDGIMRKYSDRAERTSIDEWFLEVERIPEETARALKSEIKEDTGLTCSVGVASSRLGSKMAAERSKPDGLLLLDSLGERKLIEESDVEKVVGIGKKTAEALHALGVEKVKDLKKLDKVALVEKFGKKTGSWFISLAEGRYYDLLQYAEEEQVEVSRIATLKMKTRDAGDLGAKVKELEKDNKEWLKRNNKFFRTIGITFITDDMKAHTRSLSFRNPRGWAEDCSEEVAALIRQFLGENDREVRRIGVKYTNFVDVSGQSTLAGEFRNLLEF